MRYVKIEQCKQGDVVAKDLYDNNLRLLITQGKILSNSYIEKIKVIGICGVYIEDEESKGIEVTNIITDELKFEIIQNLAELDFEKIHDSAETLVDCIINSDGICNEFINIKTFDNYTYEHSLSVSVYATMLGVSLGFSMEELVNLALSGLLHDIGKLYVDTNILNKNGKLTEEEYSHMKRHTTLGYEQVKGHQTISATVKTGIYQHHENENGTGYPLGLVGDKIYKFAKIIHIVDVFDAIISKRPYKEEKSPAYALKFLIENANTMFNAEYVFEFARIIPAYPKGTTVNLSDGRAAIVSNNVYGNTFRPVVKIAGGEEINLGNKEYRNIHIVEN